MAHVAMVTDFPDSDAAVELGRLLGERLAWCHALRLWAWGIDQDREDGTFKLEPARIAEIVSYRGDPQKFVDAMLVTGLLKQLADGSYYISGWSRNQEYFKKKRRMKAYRAKRKSRESSGDETPLETQCDAVRETPRDTARVPRSPSRSLSLKEEGEFASGVEQVAAHYLAKYPRRSAQTRARKTRDKIRDRLSEGYTVEQLCHAIDGNAASQFHIENDHTDLELVVRDAKHVDRFLGQRAKGVERADEGSTSKVAPMPELTVEQRAASIEASRRAVASMSTLAVGVSL